LKVQAGGVRAKGRGQPSAGSRTLIGTRCCVKALRASSRVQVQSPSAAFWPPGAKRSALIAAVFSSVQVGHARGLAQLALQGQCREQGNYWSKVGISGSRAPARRGLTPPSSRAPTAKHLGRATVHCRLYCSAAQALCCWCRLMSNVRPREKHKLMHLPASSPVFMKTSARSSCRSPAGEGSGWWRWRRRVQLAFRSFSKFEWRPLLCEGASRQQPGSSVVVRRSVLALGSKVLCAHRSRRLIGASRSHSPAGTTQSAGPAPGARQLHVQVRRLKQSRPGTAWPNPSIKPSPNSKAPGPRYSALSLVLQRGPGPSLLVPAYVER